MYAVSRGLPWVVPNLFKRMLMRKFFTFLLLLVFMQASAQTDILSLKTDSSYRFRTVCSPKNPADEILYVIDGIPRDAAELKRLNPALIDSIFIFKDSLKNFISCRPLRPVIVIYTKQYFRAGFTIRDKDGQDPIPGATVRFISSDRRDTLMYVSDSIGLVSRKDLKKRKSYDILVTAIGYKSFAGTVSTVRNGIIDLERDFISGPEVIVVSPGLVHQCGRGCGGHFQRVAQECGVQTKLINEQGSEIVSEQLTNNFTVYPNPVQRGQQVSLKLLAGYFPSGSIRVLTMDGKQVLTVPVNGSQKQGLVQVTMQQGWTSGVYIFQLVYANGRPGASEKVILQ
jgi:hypothetical protein